MTDTTIYHNPRCGTSRQTLALIRDSGAEPRVIEYLKTPPSTVELMELVAAMGVGLRDILRQKEAAYGELALDNPDLTDAQLLEAIAQHPVLIQRPIVKTPLGVRLCRPAETVLDILVKPQPTGQ